MQPRLLILETSQRIGKVALALGDAIVGERALDASRRHARDLAPVTHALLTQQRWRPCDLDGVIVSRGPGSYTGLRVGLMSAKTLAYATGCALLAVDTFDAIYQQVPADFAHVDIIADAQQGHIYVQRFGIEPQPLAIVTLAPWLSAAAARAAVVTGPGLETYVDRLVPGLTILPQEQWLPQSAGLLKVGLARYRQGERDDPFVVEPLYMRVSSAEEKWEKLHPRA